MNTTPTTRAVVELPAIYVDSIVEYGPRVKANEYTGKPLKVTRIGRDRNATATLLTEDDRIFSAPLTCLVRSTQEWNGLETLVFNAGHVVRVTRPVPKVKHGMQPTADTLWVVTAGNDLGDEHADVTIKVLGGWPGNPRGYFKVAAQHLVRVEHGEF